MVRRTALLFGCFMAILSCGYADEEETVQRDFVELKMRDSTEHHRIKRKVVLFETYTSLKWPNPVPFWINESHFTEHEMEAIRAVIRTDFEAHTCLNFQEHAEPPPRGQQYILFRHNDAQSGVCKAYIGMHNETRTFHGQPIYLGVQCFQLRGTLVYMIASTLGMIGEVRRPDRDEYVDVYIENVELSGRPAFAQESTVHVDTHGVPYDYGSVMHLGAKNWLDPSLASDPTSFTVLPKDRRYARAIGQKSEISFYDVMALNRAYCADACQNDRQVACQNGGFQDPKDCGQCKCADGFGNRVCSDVEEGSQRCFPNSGTIQASYRVNCLAPTRYPTPYGYGDRCSWILQTTGRRRIDAWFEDISLPSYGPGFSGCLHWVEIKDEGPDAVRGPRYCNRGATLTTRDWGRVNADFSIPSISNPITSTGNEVMVIFKAPNFTGVDMYTVVDLSVANFKLCYKISSETIDTASPEDSTQAPMNPKSQGQSEKKSDESNKYVVIGALVGGLLLILIILVLVLICCVYRRKKRQSPPPTPQPNIQVAYVNPGYGASSAVRISNVLQQMEIDHVKKDPDSLDFSQVGNPGAYPQFTNQFPPPPEYEQFDSKGTEMADDRSLAVYDNVTSRPGSK